MAMVLLWKFQLNCKCVSVSVFELFCSHLLSLVLCELVWLFQDFRPKLLCCLPFIFRGFFCIKFFFPVLYFLTFLRIFFLIQKNNFSMSQQRFKRWAEIEIVIYASVILTVQHPSLRAFYSISPLSWTHVSRRKICI